MKLLPVHILVIDDEPSSLVLLQEYLCDDFQVVAFDRARAGLAYLDAGHRVDAIVVDRMMPEMDGITFMAEVQKRPQLRTIPVVMQSAAVTHAEVTEGIASGVFYYLSKPFSRVALHAVLSNALRIYGVYRDATSELSSIHEALRMLDSCDLTLRTLPSVSQVSTLVSALYPNPGSVSLGIRELVLNAVEHGNAGITYEEKTALHRAGTWNDEVCRRLALPENRDKTVSIRFRRRPTEIVLTIEDCGPGFDWERYLTLDIMRIADNHGRGIAISLLTSFDRVEYVAPGNQVICTKKLG